MWFAPLIKTLGVESVPLQHKDYRNYAVALEQQYQKLRAKLNPAIGRKARIAGPGSIKADGFYGRVAFIISTKLSTMAFSAHPRTKACPFPW